MANGIGRDKKIPKRELTLAKIRTASRELFYEKGFHESSVEEIATNAGIKRATFYLYYQRKEDIIVDLLRDDLRYQIEQYQKLATLNEIDHTAVKNWLIQFRNAFDERRGSIPLYVAATDLARELTVSVDRHRKEVLEVLGARFPSFDLDALGRADRTVQRAKCYMVIFMIESCMNTFSTSTSAPTLDEGIDLLAELLYQFLTEGVVKI